MARAVSYLHGLSMAGLGPVISGCGGGWTWQLEEGRCAVRSRAAPEHARVLRPGMRGHHGMNEACRMPLNLKVGLVQVSKTLER